MRGRRAWAALIVVALLVVASRASAQTLPLGGGGGIGCLSVSGSTITLSSCTLAIGANALSFGAGNSIAASGASDLTITSGGSVILSGLGGPGPYAESNNLNVAWSTNGSATLGINRNGFQAGTTQTRSTIIYNGQSNALVTVTGSTGEMLLASTLNWSPFVFANIATTMTTNGQMRYCSDCTIANPCAGGGTGAIAKRLNGVNVCN